MTKVSTTISSAKLKRIFKGEVTLRKGTLSNVKKRDIPNIVHARDLSGRRRVLPSILNKATAGKILSGKAKIKAGRLSVYKMGDPIVFARNVSERMKS